MDDFLKWLISNTLLANSLIVSVILLLLVIASTYVIAFVQGRKISFWPPGIGEKAALAQATDTKTMTIASKGASPDENRAFASINYASTPFDKSLGLVEIYSMQDQDQQNKRNGDTKQIILQGSTFYLLALSAVSYIDPGIKRHWDYLRAKVENGAPFYLLLLDPFHKEKKYRDRLNKIATSFDPKFRFDLLVNLYNTYPNVSVRIAKQNIYCSLFFSEREMIYDPYHMGKMGDRLENNFFNVRIVNSNNTNNYYYVLKRHFDYLWSMADEFETFVENHANDLLPGHEQIRVRSRIIG